MAAAGIEDRGAVFTRREVVEFILDRVGYTAGKSLHQARILEPAVGRGGFLLPTIDRRLDAYARAPDASQRSIVPILVAALARPSRRGTCRRRIPGTGIARSTVFSQR